jgi:TonB family protein
MSAKKFWLFVIASVIWPHAASALQSDAAVWQKITTDQGCIAYLYDRNNAHYPGWRAYHWTGSCTAGQPINGQGILQEHGLFFEERVVTEYRGTMVQGYFQGEMTRLPFDVNESGEWDSSNPIAELAFTAPYERGCWVDKQSEYTQKFCEQDRPGLIVSKISKKPLWRDVKGSNPTALPSAAASPPKPADGIWTKMQNNGCTLIFNHSFDGYTADYSGDFSGNKILSLAPTFSCGPDGLAQGPVRIVTTWQILKGSSAGAISVDTMTASASGGLLDGNVQTITAGTVSWAGQTRDYIFAGGCQLNEPNCDKAMGQQLRSEYLAARAQVNSVSNNTKPQIPAPLVFSKAETVAFENLGTSLAELIKNVGPGGFQNEQAKIEAIVAQLGLSFYSGQGAAFGGDFARVQSVQNALRTLLSGKGASADTGQLVDLVMGAVKDGLALSKQSMVASPVPSVPPAVIQMSVKPIVAPNTVQAVAPPPPLPVGLPFERRWSVRDVGRGCKIILRDGDLMWDVSGANVNGQLSRIEWSGPCGANGLAQGPGELAIISDSADGLGRNLRRGSVENGLLNGNFSLEDQLRNLGRWELWSDDGGPRQWSQNYISGCPSGDVTDPNCDPAIAMNIRANFLAGKVGLSAIPDAPPRQTAAYVAPPPSAPPPVTYSNAVMIGPKLISDIGSMMRYPLEAERNGWQGRVGFSLSISATGSVQQCTVTGSSGYAVLDNATCDMMRRATFSPARNAGGNLVAATYNSAIRWQLP